MFRVGDIVMHPGCGICKVIGMTCNKDSQPKAEEIKYVLKPKKPLPGDFELLISEEKLGECGVHYPIDKHQIPQVFQIFKKNPNDLSDDSKSGYPLTKEKIKTGDIDKIAEVIRDLEARDSSVFFSNSNSLLQSARNIFIEEIAFVEAGSKSNIEKLIDDMLRKR